MEEAGIAVPIVVGLALTNVKAIKMAMASFRSSNLVQSIDREIVILPEGILQGFDEPVPKIFNPMFDMIWNARRFSESPNYDADGNDRT